MIQVYSDIQHSLFHVMNECHYEWMSLPTVYVILTQKSQWRLYIIRLTSIYNIKISPKSKVPQHPTIKHTHTHLRLTMIRWRCAPLDNAVSVINQLSIAIRLTPNQNIREPSRVLMDNALVLTVEQSPVPSCRPWQRQCSEVWMTVRQTMSGRHTSEQPQHSYSNGNTDLPTLLPWLFPGLIRPICCPGRQLALPDWTIPGHVVPASNRW